MNRLTLLALLGSTTTAAVLALAPQLADETVMVGPAADDVQWSPIMPVDWLSTADMARLYPPGVAR